VKSLNPKVIEEIALQNLALYGWSLHEEPPTQIPLPTGLREAGIITDFAPEMLTLRNRNVP